MCLTCKISLSSQIRLPVTLSLALPFFGNKKTSLTQANERDLDVDDDKLILQQKLIEADQLFLANKYEDVVRLLGEYKVITFDIIVFIAM